MAAPPDVLTGCADLVPSSRCDDEAALCTTTDASGTPLSCKCKPTQPGGLRWMCYLPCPAAPPEGQLCPIYPNEPYRQGYTPGITCTYPDTPTAGAQTTCRCRLGNGADGFGGVDSWTCSPDAEAPCPGDIVEAGDCTPTLGNRAGCAYLGDDAELRICFCQGNPAAERSSPTASKTSWECNEVGDDCPDGPQSGACEARQVGLRCAYNGGYTVLECTDGIGGARWTLDGRDTPACPANVGIGGDCSGFAPNTQCPSGDPRAPCVCIPPLNATDPPRWDGCVCDCSCAGGCGGI